MANYGSMSESEEEPDSASIQKAQELIQENQTIMSAMPNNSQSTATVTLMEKDMIIEEEEEEKDAVKDEIRTHHKNGVPLCWRCCWLQIFVMREMSCCNRQVKSAMANECVRVDPTVIKFINVQVGQVYKAKVTATNVSKKLKKIYFYMPSSKLFKFTQSSAKDVVVPGLYSSGWLEFRPQKEENVKSAILIYTDDDTIEVPILAFPVQCCLRMNPVVDFGCVAAISQILSKQHSITNHGSAPGWFQVQKSDDHSIKITPTDGFVEAGSTQWITIELRTDTMREVNEDIIVRLQNCSSNILNIRAKVVDHKLEIFDLKGVPLSCLWFGPAYFGTSCVETIVLRNNSPHACEWVCVLQTSVLGTEMGTDLQRSTTTNSTLLEKMQNCSLYSQDISEVFMCFPTHGRLEAYNQSTLTLCFRPGYKRSNKEKDCHFSSRRQDYSLFLLFESVGSKHGFTHINGNTGVELAVTGSGFPVSLLPNPSPKFTFRTCVTGECTDLLCVLQNLCPQLPINFRFRKLPHFSTKPSAGTIAPGKCKNIVISFSPRQQGDFHMFQKIDVLGEVMQHEGSSLNDKFEGLQLRTFHTIALQLSAVCRSRTTHPKPQLNPVPVAVLSADKTKLHKHSRRNTVISGNQEFVTFPNERAQSLRPPTLHTQCRTIFTDVSRQYVDTSYTFTQQEEEKRKKNLQIYSDLFSQRRQKRQQKLQQKRQEKMENDVDIGIEPSQGQTQHHSLKFKEITGLSNAVPSTNQEMAECNRTLTIQELYQVVIGPLSVDFGEVCVKSVCTQTVEMINHLPVHVWVQLEVNCSELQGSSPVSYVLPPHSQAALVLIFQSTDLGEFYRTVPYTINQKHPGQIVLQAEELSDPQKPQNHPAEFTWKPVITDSGTQFSIRPATGVVKPYKELQCEVVWHAAFSAPTEGDFVLSVHEGKKQRLHCVAKVGCTTVQLIEKKRVTFKSVPINMTSVRTAVLHNTGVNHAFFQVLNVCPTAGLVVSPTEGVVPRGGQAVLSIHLYPNSDTKFDTMIKIALKDSKTIDVRIGGSVENPNIEISRSSFQLFGVYLELTAGSEPGGTVELQCNEVVNCFLTFCPTQVASYDFELPITVNGMLFSNKRQSTLPSSSSTLSTSCTLTPGSGNATVPVSVSIATGSTTVEATVVCAPVQLSPDSLHFVTTSPFKSCKQVSKTMCMIDGEEPLCTVSPSSGILEPGQSICVEVSVKPHRLQRVTKLSLPLYLGDKQPGTTRDYEERYRELSITVYPVPHITVHPPQLLFTPVPLGCNMTVTLTVMATGYTSGTHITAEVSDVDLENGRKQQPLSLAFPQGTQISAQPQNKNPTGELEKVEKDTSFLICTVSFSSDTPLTLSSTITFRDHYQNRFHVKVWAVADNCLLTAWPYVALHRSEQQVILKDGATAVEAILQNFHIPSVGSFSSASTFGLSSSFKKFSSAGCFPEGIDTSENSSSDEESSYSKVTPTNFGVPEFYTSNSEQGLFYQCVLVAVERWFSLFGWANGPYPISVPHTVRRVELKTLTNIPNGKAPKKGFRSVVDLLIHLTGKEVPGIPRSQSISTLLSQRTLQLVQMYKAILEFLRVQGACLPYIKPEYLLDNSEYMHWCSLQVKDSTISVDYSSINYESMSKRSWTDLLLQIYKVFILCRVSCKDLTRNFKEKTVWTDDGTPPGRWIVNFDFDFIDGLVLAALLAAYCPYLICSHFRRMYIYPSSMEEILHNNIIVVQVLTSLSLNIDLHPTDLSNPNPVQMLMLCVHLNKKLPQYQPTQTIIFSGELHSTIRKQVQMTIPTVRPCKYKALLLGGDAHLFSLPGGSSLTFSTKESSDLTIAYSCAYLQPKEAALLLISSSTLGAHGSLAFHLKTCITQISPMKTVKCSSPCYKPKIIQLTVTNPYKNDGDFKVKLIDSVNNPLKLETLNQCQHATCKPNSLVENMTEKRLSDPNDAEEDTEFLCTVNSVFLKSGQEHTLNILYLPFNLGSKYCCVLLACAQVGDMVYMVKAAADLPEPLMLSAKSSEHINSSAVNMAWEQALATWGQYSMTADEHRRRSLTRTLHSSSVRGAAAMHKLRKQQAFLNESENGILYSMEVSLSENFTLPKTVTIPVNESFKIPCGQPAVDCRYVELPLSFQADSVGTFTCKMVLSSWCDTRVYMLEAVVTTEEKSAHLDFTTSAHDSVTQYIPLHNNSDQDLRVNARVCGEGFTGPEMLSIAADTKTCYPLTFHPETQGIVMVQMVDGKEIPALKTSPKLELMALSVDATCKLHTEKERQEAALAFKSNLGAQLAAVRTC
ncbi:hypothetical protein WMY93_022614 [Mugilogobius chulae]|uniref:Calponin-homology (CH) domain-containing protein n=1 Tax=Mugilogobius chulae TaxID=88201 RepID=A0AAW0NIL2_9GOBI